MISYLTKIIEFVRRITQPKNKQNNFREKPSKEEKNKEKQVNEMNRKITLLFLDFSHELLTEILEGIAHIIGDTPEEVKYMLEELSSAYQEGEVGRINLQTPNLDGSYD